jgi:hypothetical protein
MKVHNRMEEDKDDHIEEDNVGRKDFAVVE